MNESRKVKHPFSHTDDPSLYKHPYPSIRDDDGNNDVLPTAKFQETQNRSQVSHPDIQPTRVTFGFSSKHSDQKRSAELRLATNSLLFLSLPQNSPKVGLQLSTHHPSSLIFLGGFTSREPETLSTARTSSVRPATQTVLRLFLKDLGAFYDVQQAWILSDCFSFLWLFVRFLRNKHLDGPRPLHPSLALF